jgi:hypothetical protein
MTMARKDGGDIMEVVVMMLRRRKRERAADKAIEV